MFKRDLKSEVIQFRVTLQEKDLIRMMAEYKGFKDVSKYLMCLVEREYRDMEEKK